jgi:O-acetyl-ADP-ribose deacetylase (regulator of RNase III)
MAAQVTIRVGNILHQADCDALVNSANERLRAGSGVCGAIHGAAGPELEACSSKLAPLALSAVVITPGFRLANPWVIHVRGPKYLFDDDPPAALALAMRNVIELADSKGMKRIAVPAISTGVYGYPMAEAAQVLVATAKSCASECVNLEEIRFVVVTQKAEQDFPVPRCIASC